MVFIFPKVKDFYNILKSTNGQVIFVWCIFFFVKIEFFYFKEIIIFYYSMLTFSVVFYFLFLLWKLFLNVCGKHIQIQEYENSFLQSYMRFWFLFFFKFYFTMRVSHNILPKTREGNPTQDLGEANLNSCANASQTPYVVGLFPFK